MNSRSVRIRSCSALIVPKPASISSWRRVTDIRPKSPLSLRDNASAGTDPQRIHGLVFVVPSVLPGRRLRDEEARIEPARPPFRRNPAIQKVHSVQGQHQPFPCAESRREKAHHGVTRDDTRRSVVAGSRRAVRAAHRCDRMRAARRPLRNSRGCLRSRSRATRHRAQTVAGLAHRRAHAAKRRTRADDRHRPHDRRETRTSRRQKPLARCGATSEFRSRDRLFFRMLGARG